jgi:hypothetical protein
MARPLKEGVDYFSLDCYMDDKIRMIQAEFGLKGFAIVVKLWQTIYREHGYYCEWNEEKKLLFASEEGADCGPGLINEIVQACIRRDIFSKKLFDKYQILTSRGIQKRYLSITAKRKKAEMKKEYSLVEVAHNSINDDNNRVNVGKNQVNSVDNTQSKVKESKVNNNAPASASSDLPEEDDEGMDPDEAYRIWKAQQEKKNES